MTSKAPIDSNNGTSNGTIQKLSSYLNSSRLNTNNLASNYHTSNHYLNDLSPSNQVYNYNNFSPNESQLGENKQLPQIKIFTSNETEAMSPGNDP